MDCVGLAPLTSTFIFGNWGNIIPRSVQASLLRNNLSTLSVMYTICLVVTPPSVLSFPDSRRMVAPRMLMAWLSAACIFRRTGIRSLAVNPSVWMTLSPARQL